MTKIDDGGSIQPEQLIELLEGHPVKTVPQAGLTMLDYFAAAALAGLVTVPQSNMSTSDCAQHAYAFAAAVLAERKRLMGG